MQPKPEPKTLMVFQQNRAGELKPTDLLVYSFLAKKACYGEMANHQQIAGATGICNKTVPKCLERLTDLDLYDPETGRCIGKLSWFVRANQGTEKHWSRKIAFWTYYVPKKDSPLTVHAALLYSWLCKKRDENFIPKHGWSPKYIGIMMRMDTRTVNRSLEVLEEFELARHIKDSGIIQVRRKLKPEHFPLFAVKGEGYTPQVEIVLQDWE